jgi:hypothetical protein
MRTNATGLGQQNVKIRWQRCAQLPASIILASAPVDPGRCRAARRLPVISASSCPPSRSFQRAARSRVLFTPSGSEAVLEDSSVGDVSGRFGFREGHLIRAMKP